MAEMLAAPPRLRPSLRAPARMAPLATLPVFLDLAGRRVVVAGGSAAASWKAELLAAAGAEVDVYSDQASHAMRELVLERPTAGSLTLFAWACEAPDLEGARIAVADLPDPAQARTFVAMAHGQGVLVNVIDQPAFCDFQFGAIVNRSPVVVGISTDGAAPILAQAIRRRIEAILPQGLAQWAAAAGKLRDQVAARWPRSADRRSFWERFVDRAFMARSGPEPERALLGLTGADHERGRVVLVGAGPGDAEMLTLKAVRALQSADVILFDDLVDPGVLELARREARRIHVGKRGHRPSCCQHEINQELVRLAGHGQRVVRLKCGDPMVFGRGGEEIAALEAAGVAVEVVPGITAGLALAAALGVSLTHRDLAHSVRFVTGHGRQGGLPEGLDWAGMADPQTTLIVYMGGRTASALAARLISHGLPASTGACVVADIGRPGERRWQGELGVLEQGVRTIGWERPILIGIGGVFAASSHRPGAVPAGGATMAADYFGTESRKSATCLA